VYCVWPWQSFLITHYSVYGRENFGCTIGQTKCWAGTLILLLPIPNVLSLSVLCCIVCLSHSTLIWGCCLYIIVFVLIAGHFVAPFAAHAFCNHMGFPDFAEILTYKEPQRIFLMSVLVLGLVAWCMLLTPLTNPAWYSNQLFWKNHWYLFNWVYIICMTPLDIIQSRQATFCD